MKKLDFYTPWVGGLYTTKDIIGTPEGHYKRGYAKSYFPNIIYQYKTPRIICRL